MTTLLDADEAQRLLAELAPAAEHTVLARALRTVVALHAAVDGRETPPKDAEIDAHAVAGGVWFVFATRSWGDTSWHTFGDPRAVRAYIRDTNAPDPNDPDGDWRWSHRWIAFDHNGRPCARPKVTP